MQLRKHMKTIFKKNWAYVFYQKEEDFFLEAVCGSVAIFELTIKLNPEEKSAFLAQGEEYISCLAQAISNSPQNFQNRKVDLTTRE